MTGDTARCRRRAFTLIEALFVLALAAILTAAAAVPLVAASRAAAERDVAGRVTAFDRLGREYARRSERSAWLVFDLNAGTIRREAAGGEASTLPLPDGHRIAALYVRRDDAAGPAVSGVVAVPLSSRGQSPSYAVLLQGRGQSSPGQWVVLAGLTGRAVTVAASGNEGEVDQLFRALSGEAAGGDAR